ncbi:hypothetical protein ES703_50641 [subsurface metagenome]
MKQPLPDMLQSAGQEVKKRQPEKNFNLDKAMGEIVGVFCDPIIVMPGGWGDTLPGWLKEAITLERLIENIEGSRRGAMTATDAEACAYLYTASLTAPMGHNWSQIYLYIAGKTYTRWKKTEMPEDIQVESLRDDQLQDLNRLKEWLYRKRTTIRLDRDRAERRQKKEEEAARKKTEQPALFDF